MIDHKKIEDAIDSYFKNTPTAKIIENLDRLSADREKDLERENINHKTANSKDSIIGNLVRFEEVSPANQDAAFLAVSIEQLVAHLGLPLYEGYDDLDEMRLTFLTLPSGETVTLGEYRNCPQPGTSIYVDAAMQNIPQIVFDSCLKLQVAREEVIWFHPDWQEEIDRLYAEHGVIEKRPESLQVEELAQHKQYEPIDCFNHALRIYTREYVPATYWAMLQHNLGLAYFNRNKGDRRKNLERSIKCFNNSLEIYTQDDFPEKWKINQDDLEESQREIEFRKLYDRTLLVGSMTASFGNKIPLANRGKKKYSRRYEELANKIENRAYEPLEAMRLLNETAKFAESAEVYVRLGLNPKYTDQQLRTTVALPKGTGQTIRIAVITCGDKVSEAAAAGADIYGSEELIAKIAAGKIDFDLLIATPDMMPQIAKLGRILGPRGLMPSPKAGTVATDLGTAIAEFKAGKLEYRADKAGIVHILFGKANFAPEDLLSNLKALQESIERNRPSGAKGRFWRSMYVSATMGPSIEVDISTLKDLKS
jgi:large subunit ribosomal protein L1